MVKEVGQLLDTTEAMVRQLIYKFDTLIEIN